MGKVDVVVCDGFVGNVVLKFGEGFAEAILRLFKRGIKAHPLSLLGGLFIISYQPQNANNGKVDYESALYPMRMLPGTNQKSTPVIQLLP
jgi:fatty acid/phospholipid biosynthesis enzyme